MLVKNYNLNISIILLFIFLFGCSQKDLDIIKNNEPITKVEMKINYKDSKDITITDPTVLDNISKALREASGEDVQKGGAFEILTHVKVYKQKDLAEFTVIFSKYHGWYVEIDRETLRCYYLYDLVRQYANKKQ